MAIRELCLLWSFTVAFCYRWITIHWTSNFPHFKVFPFISLEYKYSVVSDFAFIGIIGDLFQKPVRIIIMKLNTLINLLVLNCLGLYVLFRCSSCSYYCCCKSSYCCLLFLSAFNHCQCIYFFWQYHWYDIALLVITYKYSHVTLQNSYSF